MRIFTVPADVPFLDALARAILAGGFPEADRPPPEPAELAHWRLFLPTRRAKAALADSLFRHCGGARLLPRISILGALDEDEFEREHDLDTPDIPPAVGEFERRFILAHLIESWARTRPETSLARHGAGSAQALSLAASLAQLIDSFEIENIPLAELAELFRGEMADHQRDALDFLDHVRTGYPKLLGSRGRIGSHQRRSLLIDREAERLGRGSRFPMIAAGSTGSVPATARMMAAIAKLDSGAVVLPGLDQDLDDDAWAALSPQDAQYGLKLLLERLGIERAAVQLLPGIDPNRRSRARSFVLGEAMRPAATTDRWRQVVAAHRDTIVEGIAGLRLIAAPDQRLEAAAIALIMRRAIDEPNRTATLVTPDRSLARRVKAELARWNLAVVDSAGEVLSHLPQGMLASLILSAAVPAAEPEQLVALLAHPDAAFGFDRRTTAWAAGLLEIALLRGSRARRSLAELATALEEMAGRDPAGEPVHRLVGLMKPEHWDAVRALLEGLAAALSPIGALMASRQPLPLPVFLDAHRAAIDRARAQPDAGAGDNFWAMPGGAALARLFDDIAKDCADAPPMTGEDYRAFFDRAVGDMGVPIPVPMDQRLRIYGLLEARLIAGDVMILAGLNERLWPREPDADPWLNRPERERLGLPTPERRIGLSAHDFVQCAAASQAWLCTSGKVGDHPAVPSRFLLRLRALLSAAGLEDALRPEEDWVGYALGLDFARRHSPVAQPAPRPPIGMRPTSLSVTRVETLIRDPYAVHARMILKLEELEPLWQEAGAAERGSLLHDALRRFFESDPPLASDAAAAALVAIVDELIADADIGIAQAAFWRQEMRRIAEWFSTKDATLRSDARRIHPEVKGAMDLLLGDGSLFRISARADRIDEKADGTLRLIDYKTGSLPSFKDAAARYSPQLLLEALMAERGGFANLAPAAVSELVYFHLTGRHPEAGESKTLSAGLRDYLDAAEAGVKRLLTAYRDAAQAYYPTVPENQQRHDRYGHLSRWREWIHASLDQARTIEVKDG
jgi:ATP-dependent helicase/nuclease subunit B